MNSWKCARRLRLTALRKEHVHQHRLAAADIAKQVEPRSLFAALARAKQPAERRRLARQPALAQPRFQPANRSSASS